jgi:hypothetical protein
MVLTCVAAVAVVWLGLWGVIRLERTMGEARLRAWTVSGRTGRATHNPDCPHYRERSVRDE